MALVGAGQEFRRALAARGVHAHVERAVGAEREAACRVVDLRRRDAEVEQDPARLRDAARSERRCHPREHGVPDREARIAGERRIGHCTRDRLGIAVERDQAAARRQPLEHRAPVAAAAEHAVHVDDVVIGADGLDRFAQENAQVLHGCAEQVRS